jgi:hypothetical protein
MTFMCRLMQESCILADSGKFQQVPDSGPESGIPAHGDGDGDGARIEKMCQNLSVGARIWHISGTISLPCVVLLAVSAKHNP